MCYDLEASQRASVIGIISAFILYQSTNNSRLKGLAIFFGYVSLMQIYDWIFWETQDLLDPTKKKINQFFTKLAMITNHLQPLVYAWVIVYIAKLSLSNTCINLLILYAISGLIYSINIWNTLDVTVPTEKSGDSLDWEWNSGYGASIVYALFLASFTVTSLQIPGALGITLSLINILTFLFSAKTAKNKNIGRLWCNIAAYVPLFLLIFK